MWTLSLKAGFSFSVAILIVSFGESIQAQSLSQDAGSPASRFEDYPSWNDLREKLLQLHPPGSSLDKAVDAVTKAGAKCIPISSADAKKIWDANADVPLEVLERSTNLICDYSVQSGAWSTFRWRLYLRGDQGKVAVIRAHSG